jgi:hypothetical protein
MFLGRKAQSISEYVLMVAVVLAAVFTMQIYARRGIQASIRSAADALGEQAQSIDDVTYGTLGSSTMTTVSNTDIHTSTGGVATGGSQTTTIDSSSTTTGTARYIKRNEQ